jgi:hypothetical protein
LTLFAWQIFFDFIFAYFLRFEGVNALEQRHELSRVIKKLVEVIFNISKVLLKLSKLGINQFRLGLSGKFFISRSHV